MCSVIHLQKLKIILRNPKLSFGKAGDAPDVFDFTGLPNGLSQSAASDINAEFCHFPVLLQADFSNYTR
jgi:hypothetical protein